MRTAYPSDELINTYETLKLLSETAHTATYGAQGSDFLVVFVTINKRNLTTKVPSIITISTAWEE